MEIKKINFARTIREYVIITLGLILFTIGWSAFLIPLKITGGGATGVANLVFMLSGERIPIGVTFFAFNAILIVIAAKVVGISFGMKTIYAVLVASLLFIIEGAYIKTCVLEHERLLATIIGGALTGGTDIIAMIITKYKNISPGRAILAADAIIISSAFFVLYDKTIPERIEALVYGYLTMITTAYMVDLYLSGMRQSLQVMILSNKRAEIADRITKEMHRGVTLLKGSGWYSKEETEVIMVVIRKNEQGALLHLVRDIDPNAFTSVGSVMGVYGNGFDRIK